MIAIISQEKWGYCSVSYCKSDSTNNFYVPDKLVPDIDLLDVDSISTEIFLCFSFRYGTKLH